MNRHLSTTRHPTIAADFTYRVGRTLLSGLLALLLLLNLAPWPWRATAATPAGASALPAAGTTASGQVVSRLLGDAKPYLIYLPPGYESGAQRYPVLYLLHGMGGDFREWYDQGIFDDADSLMGGGGLPPFLIVLPEGDRSYWMNWADDGPRYADYVVSEVAPFIDANYRTIPAPASRAIGGLSMGGTGALQIAYNHPDVFGVAGGHSPTLRTEATALAYMGRGSFFASQDPVELAATAPGAAAVRTWLDVGEGDEWRSRVEEVHDALTARGIAHAFSILEGNHEREYWQAHGATYLGWYGRTLKRG